VRLLLLFKKSVPLLSPCQLLMLHWPEDHGLWLSLEWLLLLLLLLLQLLLLQLRLRLLLLQLVPHSCIILPLVNLLLQMRKLLSLKLLLLQLLVHLLRLHLLVHLLRLQRQHLQLLRTAPRTCEAASGHGIYGLALPGAEKVIPGDDIARASFLAQHLLSHNLIFRGACPKCP